MPVATITGLLISLLATACVQTAVLAPSVLAASSPSRTGTLPAKRNKRTKLGEWQGKRRLPVQKRGDPSSQYMLPPNLGIGIGVGM